MIDKITLVKNNINNSEKLQVIERNNLKKYFSESTNITNYDNAKTKNLTGGILIKITGDQLKIEGSVHKYFNFLKERKLENYTVFTMIDFTETIKILFKNFGIIDDDFLLINFEIGLNIWVGDYQPIDFLKQAKSIGNLDGKQRKLYINPRYKNERFLTTQMHKDNTLVFRIYDKNFERMDKGKKNIINACLRIETLRTRQKNLSFIEFCKPYNLTLLQNRFFREWNLLNFDKEVSAPKGTHQNKKDLAKIILIDGTKEALQTLESKRNQMTPKIYRTSKEFVNAWDSIKTNFSLIPCEIMPKWADYYNTAIQQVIKH